MVSKEFVVYGDNGWETEWVDPYAEHVDITPVRARLRDGERAYLVSTGQSTHEVVVPEGGHFEIREMEVLGE